MEERRAIRAVLCDRDGTLVRDVPYNGDPSLVEPLPGVAAGLGRLRAAGLRLAVVSNQSGVARGLLTRAEVEGVNARLVELLGPFDAVLWCPHGPEDRCPCRKPAPGMIRAAAAACGVRVDRCVVVGDIGADVAAAGAAGAASVLVPTPVTRADEIAAAPCVAGDFGAAVDLVLRGAVRRARPLGGGRAPARPGRAVTPAVLVARLDNAGDVLLTGPAVRAAAATGRPVHLLCGPRGRAAADLLPGVAGVIELHAPWIEPLPMAVDRLDALRLVDQVRALGVTDAAILGSSHQSPLPLALLLRWAGVERIAAVSHDHAGSLLDLRLRGDPDVHEVRRSLMVTEALGFPTPEDDRLVADLTGTSLPIDVLAELPTRGTDAGYVVVHPGASVPARTLAVDQWRDVVRAVTASGRTVAVTGGPEEVRLTEALPGEPPDVIDLGGRLTLRQLGAVLAGADAVVCGNTGPMHLAAAVGTPVVAAFAPTVPVDRWRPWHVPHVVLGDQGVPCAGCRSRVCPLEEQVCLSRVSGADVVAALDVLAPARPPQVAAP